MASAQPMDFSSYNLGIQHQPILLDSSKDVRSASLALVQQAQRSIIMVSRKLDALLYNNSEFTTAVRNFVLNSRHTSLRILVHDTGPAIHSGHRLIDLSQRLSSFIEIRIPERQFAQYNSAFLVADSSGYLYREQADVYAAQCSFADRKFCDQLSHTFEEMWASSVADANLRRIQL